MGGRRKPGNLKGKHMAPFNIELGVNTANMRTKAQKAAAVEKALQEMRGKSAHNKPKSGRAKPF